MSRRLEYGSTTFTFTKKDVVLLERRLFLQLFMALVVGRKQEKTLQVLGPLAGRGTVRLRRKRETASKVALTRMIVQRWTLKGMFPFFPSSSVGVPKTFAFFSCFLCKLYRYSHG